jgi:hypothetical protein
MFRQIAVSAALLAAVLAGSCSSCRRTPLLSEADRREVVTAFHTALAALDTSQEVLARQKLDRVIALAPQEPAAWANLGLLLLRQQEIEPARERLLKAEALAPANARIQRLVALTESRRGQPAESIRHWRRALELDPADVKAAYALSQEIERQGGADADLQAQQALEQLLARGDNLPARLDYLRLAAKRGDAATLQKALQPLVAMAAGWPEPAQAQLTLLRDAAAANPRAAATRAVFLKNVLVREPAYRRALAAISTPLDAVGEPLTRFLVIENPRPQPAVPDTTLTFAISPVGKDDARASWVGSVLPQADAAPAVAFANASALWIGSRLVRVVTHATPEDQPGSEGVVVADFNYDFRVDLAIATPRGLSILKQGPDATVSPFPRSGPLTALATTPVFGAWPADIDTDGDLDLVVATTSDAPLVLRNNGDETFAEQRPFAGVSRLRGFAWMDLDADGVPDAALVDESGAVHVFLNLRGGVFERVGLPAPPEGSPVASVAAIDGGLDAPFGVAALTRLGAIHRLALVNGAWQWARLAGGEPKSGERGIEAERLIVADLDNNGAADLLVCGRESARVLLAGSNGYALLPERLNGRFFSAVDLNGDGRLDLTGVDANGRPVTATSRGAKAYRWQTVRPRAATATGDQRINSFGIGGEVELRAGLHLQRQTITSPIVHFGLGDFASSDVIRIVWPNGVLQSEFEKPANTTVAADQRLKGSCPWLFAWNGREMAFVTDLIWRSPLGLRINAQATADVLMTEDRVRLRGDQLAPRDGAYDLRVTAELWETHFFDLVSLLVVDHPADTEVFIDERFAVPPPSLAPIVTGPVGELASAQDDGGRDVSAVVRTRDDRHLDFAGRGAFQGITRDHYVELTLPDAAPRRGPLWLIAQGWVHPTDSSINVAIAQGRHAPPRGLSLHVADAGGVFREVRANLGFPSGKDKTVLVDLANVFPATGPRRLRLATNLEIFWDRLGWAAGRPDVRVAPRRLDLQSADLRFRGYSETVPHEASSPERPRYRLAGTAPRWLDLEGYYTRFGDVRALLRGVDDRYVIMNAGDELALRFAAAPPAAAGVARDFIVVSDGWVKDGDYNTSFSRTVLPLPTHATGRYDTPPRGLENDAVYRAHPDDFANYHTRYVSPSPVRRALRVSDADTARP